MTRKLPQPPLLPHAASRTIPEIRAHLAELLVKQPASGSTVGRVLQLLARLESDLAALQAEAARPVRARGPRRTEVVSHYRVQPGQRGNQAESLAEHRTSGAQPFRCPLRIYEVVARELAGAGQGISFDDLFERVRARIGDVPDYRVRMCLRFWEAAGILDHWLKKFRPSERTGTQRDGFTAAARRAWERARKEDILPPAAKVNDAYPNPRR